MGETRATLEGLVGNVDDTRTSVARADDTLAGLQDDVPHLLEAIGQSKELLAKARSTVNEYGTALSKNATDGALQLSSAAAQAQRALGTVSGDVAAAEAATNTALATAEGLLADNKTLVSDLTAQAGAADADPAIAQALSEARAANERLTTTTDALRTASDDLASTADSLEAEASALDTAAHSASETIRTTAATFQDSVLPDITSSLDSLVEACGTLEGALRGLTPVARRGAGHFGAARRHADLFRDLAFHHVRFPGHHGDEPGAVAHRPDRAAELRHREGPGRDI